MGSDAKLCWVFARWKACPEDGVVHHVEKRADAVPAFVIEPDLNRKKKNDSLTLSKVVLSTGVARGR